MQTLTQMKLKMLCKQYGFTQTMNGFKHYSGTLDNGQQTEVFIAGQDILVQAYKWHYTAEGNCVQERDTKTLNIKQVAKYLAEVLK